MVIKYADFPMKYVTEKEFRNMYVSEEDFKGYVSQISIIKANQPIRTEKNYIERANSGYKWLEFYPDNSNIAMTVTYDDQNNIIQWYFDIANKIDIKDDIPYIEDLYLDVVLTNDNKCFLLDEDELEAALEINDINKQQYDMAYKIADELIEKIKNKKQELISFSNKYFEKINLIDAIKN